MMMPAAYSPTRLATYQRCPRRYYDRYVIKIPGRPSAEKSVGISLHAALEAIARETGLTAPDRDAIHRQLDTHWEGAGFEDAAAEQRARAQAGRALENYLGQSAKTAGQTVLLESKLKAPYRSVTFLGIVDRVDRLADGTLALIDYKSGPPKPLSAERRQQLAIYRHLVSRELGRMPEIVALDHLETGTRVEVRLDESEWEETLNRAEATAAAIQRDETFSPRVEASCASCDYARRCLPYRREAAVS